MRMTRQEYEAWLAKRGVPAQGYGTGTEAGAGTDAPESDLHDYIIKRCRQLGWPFGHGSMAHRTKYVEGFPDFVIAAPDAVTYWVEVKTATGKLSPAQQAFAAACAKVGHCVHVVRSEQEFEELIK